MADLGVLEVITDLREIWPNEAHDFTPWLADEENISLLGDALGIDISVDETESSVGDFNVDILATENDTDRKIIIENQLEDTNHDHLGKLITYASGKGANIVVWVVKRPNEWVKSVKASSEGLTELKQLNLEFWEEFKKYAYAKSEFKTSFGEQAARPRSFYSLSAGSSRCYVMLRASMTKKRCVTQIYIPRDKELFYELTQKKDEIETLVGDKLIWHEASVATIIGYESNDFDMGRENWDSIFKWYCECALKLKKVIKKYTV